SSRLSTIDNFVPRRSSASATWDPMKPAPPVSKIRFGFDSTRSRPDSYVTEKKNRKLILAHCHYEIVAGKLISAVDFCRQQPRQIVQRKDCPPHQSLQPW